MNELTPKEILVFISMLLAIAAQLVFVVVWLVRLEARSNSNTEKIGGLQLQVDKHVDKTEIHHNAGQFTEFKSAVWAKFSDMEKDLTGLDTKLDKLDSKLDKFLEIVTKDDIHTNK